MTIIIDGYNLLYAVGWASRGMTRPEWNAARRRFLSWLSEQQTRKAAVFHVILDGQKTSRATPEARTPGLAVMTAYGQTADEWIDQNLAQLPAEVVVSNDQLVQESARAHRRRSWSSTEFLDWLEQSDDPSRQQAGVGEKPPLTIQAEAELLAAFSQPKPRSRR